MSIISVSACSYDSNIGRSRCRSSGIAASGCCFCRVSMSKGLMTQGTEVLQSGRPYAERAERILGVHDKVAEFLVASTYKPLQGLLRNPARALKRVIPHVERHERTMKTATDGELTAFARR